MGKEYYSKNNYLYIIGQIANLIYVKKFAKIWYTYALSKNTDKHQYQSTALESLNDGGCFCLASLVQELEKEKKYCN